MVAPISANSGSKESINSINAKIDNIDKQIDSKEDKNEKLFGNKLAQLSPGLSKMHSKGEDKISDLNDNKAELIAKRDEMEAANSEEAKFSNELGQVQEGTLAITQQSETTSVFL